MFSISSRQEKEKQLVNFDYENVNSLCQRDHYVICWFSADVTKFQTSELLILVRFYFHDV